MRTLLLVALATALLGVSCSKRRPGVVSFRFPGWTRQVKAECVRMGDKSDVAKPCPVIGQRPGLRALPKT